MYNISLKADFKSDKKELIKISSTNVGGKFLFDCFVDDNTGNNCMINLGHV